MKNNKFLAIALAATTLFASCSKSEHEGLPNDEKSKKVVISFVNGVQGPVGRSIGESVTGDATTMKFTDGMLYFTDDAGVINYSVVIAQNAVAGGIKPDELVAGAIHTFVIPSEATKVYIVGNLKGSTYPTAGNIDQITDKEMDMASQTSLTEDKGIGLVTLYGADVLTPKVGEENVYVAKISVKPIASRIEFHQFEALVIDEDGSPNKGKEITDFDIEGIFIYNFYKESYLTGKKIINGSLFAPANPADPDSFIVASGNDFDEDENGLYFNHDAAGIGEFNTPFYNAGTDVVWAYNLFAPTDAAAAFPNIVVKVNNIKIDGEDKTDKWLTVKNLKYAAGHANAGENITSMEAGKIYKIKNFKFNIDHLSDTPEQLTVTAEVEVELINWEEIDLEPEL